MKLDIPSLHEAYRGRGPCPGGALPPGGGLGRVGSGRTLVGQAHRRHGCHEGVLHSSLHVTLHQQGHVHNLKTHELKLHVTLHQ